LTYRRGRIVRQRTDRIPAPPRISIPTPRFAHAQAKAKANELKGVP
jgi:hypothetical protein